MRSRLPRPSRGAAAGFTILELTVVLGLLAAFMVFLIQLMTTGVELFDEGEEGQELSDLANTAGGAVRETMADLAGPRRSAFEPGKPDARLLVQWYASAKGASEKLHL